VLGGLLAHGLMGTAWPKATGRSSQCVPSGSWAHATRAVTALQSRVVVRLAVAPTVRGWRHELKEGRMEAPGKVRVVGAH
jgi:hypothetical protein